MKRFTLILLCFVLLALPANSYNMKHFTDDYRIVNALVLLEKYGGDEIFRNLEENAVKIMFYDLSLISYSYRQHYAINGINNMGQRLILINTRYKKSSLEEIACLIAHESCHKSKKATLEEETIATQTEAKYWILLKQPEKTYSGNTLNKRLDRLAYLYKNSDKEHNLIRMRIANSEFYREQLSME